ncbi:MAG: TrkA family potassium uptake protein [Candidatus Omnitrophota bacterium]
MYVVIVGCGRVGSELAKLLSQEDHNVVVVDKEQKSFARLGQTFNGVTLTGNGFDVELLKEAGLDKADAFCAVTNGDNTNIMAAQVAKKMFKVPKVIARIYDPERAHIYHKLGLDVISGTLLFAAMIRDKIIESHFTSYLIESGDLGVIEINVAEKFAGKTVSELNVPGDFLIATVLKNKGVVIPGPDTKLDKNDILMGVVKTTSLKKVRDFFGL